MTERTMPIDPGMLAFHEVLDAESPPDWVDWPLSRQRRSWDEACARFRRPRPDGLVVTDATVSAPHGDIPVRIYRPRGQDLLPGVIYLHGGGWVLGSIETHDDLCAELAEGAQAVVVAVDYRLAPEHPHPAQLEDNLAVLDWMRREGGRHAIDPGRIVAAGDSAGGQMSASLALWLRDHGRPQLQGMALIYPVLGSDTGTESYHRNADAPGLTRADMIFFLDAVLGPKTGPAWTDPYAMPLHGDDLGNLPPAFITAAAHDPLFDDAVVFSERLRAAGVPVALRIEPALTHSYMRARHVCVPAMAGFRAIVAAVRSLAHESRLPPEG